MSRYLDTKKCLICNKGTKNDTLYWHIDAETKDIWCWCNKCSRGYSIAQYCSIAGISLNDFLKQSFDLKEARPNEVTKIEWPKSFVPLFDFRAKDGMNYLASRGIDADDGMYYDTFRKGIVFAYYYQRVFCGAQIRLIEPYVDPDGNDRKIDTLPGTRTGLLLYGYNQEDLMPNVKALIVCEGAFNAIAINQALTKIYGGLMTNPWKAIACSGSGATKHHIDVLKDLKDKGIKIILASDSDEAGLKMMNKFVKEDAITHYALTYDSDNDWNDELIRLDKFEFAKYFLQSIKPVKP